MRSQHYTSLNKIKIGVDSMQLKQFFIPSSNTIFITLSIKNSDIHAKSYETRAHAINKEKLNVQSV